MGKEIDIIEIFGLSRKEVVVSEHPCAYRRKVSKAGKIYITTNHLCFYSLIFNSEIKECTPFKDIKGIKKVSSLIIGSSIEITTEDFKYVFGLFENADTAYWEMMRQMKYAQMINIHNNKVAPITQTIKQHPVAVDEASSRVNGGGASSAGGRVRFTSVSVVERKEDTNNIIGTTLTNNNNANNRSTLVRSRSGSVPSYAVTKKKPQQQMEKGSPLDHLVSPPKKHPITSAWETEEEADEASSSSPPRPYGGGPSINALAEASSPISKSIATTTSSSSPSAVVIIEPKQPPAPANTTTTMPSKSVRRSIMVSKDSAEQYAGSDSSGAATVSSPPRDTNTTTSSRDRSNTLFGLRKGRTKKLASDAKNKESIDKLNSMLSSRKSKENLANNYLREDVFGVPLGLLRVDDKFSACPMFALRLFQHLEEFVATDRLAVNSIYLSLFECDETLLKSLTQSINRAATDPSGDEDVGATPVGILARQIKRGREDVYKELGTPPHVVGELFKHFLSSLPQALMPEELVLCDDVDNHQYKLSMIRSLIFSQHLAHWSLFKAMVYHFVKVAQHQHVASPDVSPASSSTVLAHLSSVFGPLIVGIVPSFATDQSVRRITRVLQFILEHHDAILADYVADTQYVVKKGRQVLRAAPLSVVLVKLSDIYYRDDTLLDTFNLTHDDYFMPTTDYAQHLFSIYLEQHSSAGRTAAWRLRLRERVLFLLRTLVESKPTEYWTSPTGSNLQKAILGFTNNLRCNASFEENKLVISLEDFVRRVDQHPAVPSDSSPPAATSPPTTPTRPVASPSRKAKNDFILAATRTMPMRRFNMIDSDREELAIQMTLMDERVFRALSIFDLLKNRFAKPEQSPTFQAMVASFNRWSSWVGSEILSAVTASQRAQVIETFIEVASNLLELKNFHAGYALTMGLQHYAIKRLAQSWDRVSKKSMQVFATLQAVFSTDSNHKAYRDRLHITKPPLVPYIGIYSKDLFVVGDASQTLLDESAQILNLEKLRSIQSIVSASNGYRQLAYPMKPNVQMQAKITDRPILNDDEMYDKSLLLEPKQQQQQQQPQQ
ncbi:hypothetical protein SAMD00019534_093760 [Acytostelium subglobosum LB1]|uniref:hypothetical protein n=1 Tax=Acytostelium subglobosum LB1 TaxID=1410327 RepID=UPI0006448281|nr:hypothetical protein SAMD00019534_093760 [Acytostelium subglobosum LB1]GAM26201.1 hypothetical protein SAMD00019534_093760 [Acytostelium subglobosum LB1]|eukprot:XP_012750755.1 hypothetical protein SAMD00019534_093760 [Acytostelium subglobosum LB1]